MHRPRREPVERVEVLTDPLLAPDMGHADAAARRSAAARRRSLHPHHAGRLAAPGAARPAGRRRIVHRLTAARMVGDFCPTGGFHYGDRGNTLWADDHSCSELFRIEDLHARPADADGPTPEILRGLSLPSTPARCTRSWAPTGRGKSTLASTLLASPEYEVTSGRSSSRATTSPTGRTDVRAKAGMFLAFQYPQEIPGVSVIQFLRQALSARKGIDLSRARAAPGHDGLDEAARHGLAPSSTATSTRASAAARRSATRSCRWPSSSPSWRSSTRPTRGLDIDALRIVAKGIREIRVDRPQMGVVLITHYQRLLDEVQPDHVHILVGGRIVASGGMELAAQLERDGYEAFR